MTGFDFIQTEDNNEQFYALRSIRIQLLKQGYYKIPTEEDLTEMIEDEIFREGRGYDDLEDIVLRVAGQRGIVKREEPEDEA